MGRSQGVTTGAKAGTQACQRKTIVYIATSVDGYVARSDGDVDWLNRPLPKGSYGMDAFARSIDTVLWGRKTYDFAVKMGGLGASRRRVCSGAYSGIRGQASGAKGQKHLDDGRSIDHCLVPGLRSDRRILDPCHPRDDWRRDSAGRSSPSEYPARIDYRPFLPGRCGALELHRSIVGGRSQSELTPGGRGDQAETACGFPRLRSRWRAEPLLKTGGRSHPMRAG